MLLDEHTPLTALVTEPPRPRLVWQVTRSIFIDYFRVFHCLRYRFIRAIPRHGCVIFAPNHVSYYDPPVAGAGIPYELRFMAWEALFRVPLVGTFIRHFGAFPVKVKSADRTAVELTLNVLREGGLLVIFPEGERSHDGKLAPFEKGMARLALSVGASVVPVAITGAYESYSRDKIFPRWGRRVMVKYYPEIKTEPVANPRDMRDAVAKLNARVHAIIDRRMRAYAKLQTQKKCAK